MSRFSNAQFNSTFSSENTMEPIRKTRGRERFSSNAFTENKVDLRTPQGLYNVAEQVGLGKEADRMIQRSGGEQMKFGSGGFIMDTMDVLNTFSYGMVGVIKGKGFAEGVKNRETFTDDESLGKHGFLGKVAGFAADILVDPLTYVAPVKILSKIPGVAQTAEAAKFKLLGEVETIQVEGQKFFRREGGWSPLTYAADKIVYGNAVDMKFLDGYRSVVGRNEALVEAGEDMMLRMSKIDPEKFKLTISRGQDGRLLSTDIKELRKMADRGEISTEDLTNFEEMYGLRDNLMQQLVDLGALSKAAKDKHWGTYLKQSYDEFLDAGGAGMSRKGTALDTRGRKQGLTQEAMEELGQVDEAGVVWGTTLLKQIRMVRDAELQQFISRGYAMSDEAIATFKRQGGNMDDLVQVPDSKNYTMAGARADLTKQLKDSTKQLKNVLKERRIALKDQKELVSTIRKMEKRLNNLQNATAEEIGDAISGVRHLLRQSGITQGPAKKKATSKAQKMLESDLVTWLNRGGKKARLERETIPTKDLWKEYRKTSEGLVLERAFEDPRRMYQWKSPEEFLDAIRYPDKAKVFKESRNELVGLSDEAQEAAIKRAEKAAREFGETEQAVEVLKGTNLKLVNEAVDRLEDAYSDVLFERSEILKALEHSKMGDLAGKWVSKPVWDMVKGSFEPQEEFGRGLMMRFKHAKVIWNPSSHIRNMMSASIQNWWKLGIGPWNVGTYVDAFKELKHGGKFVNDMKSMGFSERSGYINELLDNYLSNKKLLGKSVNKQLNPSLARKYFKHIDRFFMNSYAHVDNVAKVAAYKHGIKKGLPKEQAFKEAMAATFNYSEVTPFVHRMRQSMFGVPFITFSLKAVPLTAETLAKSPGKISVFGKARNTLFQAAGIEAEQEAEAMPAWMRDDTFMMRLPWKDDNGRSMYFDLSYIIPFGALVDGSYLKDPLSANPVLQTVRELSRNETFSGSKIFRETDSIETVVADITLHISKLGLPPAVIDAMSDGYGRDGQRRDAKIGPLRNLSGTEELGPNERSYFQEVFRYVALGATPFNLTSQESNMAYRQKENLTKLLTERGLIKPFETSYLPADSPLRPENRSFGDSIPQAGGEQWTIR